MPNMLGGWLGDTFELSKPKALETAKALRQRKAATDKVAQGRGVPQVGGGNVFQRRRAGMDQVVDEASN